VERGSWGGIVFGQERRGRGEKGKRRNRTSGFEVFAGVVTPFTGRQETVRTAAMREGKREGKEADLLNSTLSHIKKKKKKRVPIT